MGTEQRPAESTRVKKGARPFTGFLYGLIFGVAVAVILQQAGIWPLDRLLLFGSAGVFALIGILIGRAGRARVSPFANVLPLILAFGLLAWGATGVIGMNETGELNGGCTVEATSSVDGTVVTDTSRQDPFDVDPEGSLSWVARSPGPITNHLWDIHVDVGGFSVPVAGNDEPDPNSDGDQENAGDVADVSAYIQEVSDFTGLELRGVFEVGGAIEGEGGACDGFAFVRLTADPLATLVSQIAAGVALLALIGLLSLVFNRTRESEVVIGDEAESDSFAEVGGATAGAGAGGVASARDDDGRTSTGGGAHIRRDDVVDESGVGTEESDDHGGDGRDDV